MAPCSEHAGLVTLKGGMVARVAAIELLLDLERRRFRLEPADGGRLRVQPHEQLTPEDREAIRQYRDELLVLVTYVERM